MSRKAARTSEDPRNNFLALKLALALKKGDGDKFCEAYDKPSLSGLGLDEVKDKKKERFYPFYSSLLGSRNKLERTPLYQK